MKDEKRFTVAMRREEVEALRALAREEGRSLLGQTRFMLMQSLRRDAEAARPFRFGFGVDDERV